MSVWKISARKLISYEQNVYHILNEELKKTGLNASLRAKHKSDQLKMSKQEKANIILVSPSRPFTIALSRSLTLFLCAQSAPSSLYFLSFATSWLPDPPLPPLLLLLLCVLMVFRREKIDNCSSICTGAVSCYHNCCCWLLWTMYYY